MFVKDLIKEIELFQKKLKEHRELYASSLSRNIPDHPLRNNSELREQLEWLNRKLGSIKQYLLRFHNNWVMGSQIANVKWNSLDEAVGQKTAQIKGQSLDYVIDALNQILGKLDNLDPDDNVPEDVDQPIRPGIGLDNLMQAYLPHLHPYIVKGCNDLFIDGHYAEAIEEAIKAVLQYIREKTSLTGDGEALINNAFSLNNPILAFSDLSDQTKKNEQLGFMNMLKGFVQGVRHPLAHTYNSEEKAHNAFEYLIMASLFCRRIDDASS
jgi:uncharacterized protein (TIGR02391 family)